MPRLTVRTALAALFIAASGVPVLVFWAWPHGAALQSQFDEVEERHLLLARQAADRLDQYAQQTEAVFAALAPVIERDGDLAFADEILNAMFFRHFCRVDIATGEVIAAYSPTGAPVPPQMPAARVAKMQALAAARPGRLARRVSVAPGATPMLFMARSDGEVLTVAAITTEKFALLAAGITFGERGHAAIADARGRALAHPDSSWAADARDISALAPVAQMIDGVTEGVTTFWSPKLGEEVIAGFTRVADTGWGVMVPQPVSELTAKADAISRSALAILVAGVALSSALALIVSRIWARTLSDLSRAAARIARGEDSVRVSVGLSRLTPIELCGLAEAFNRLSAEVETSRRRLMAMAETDGLTGLPNRRAFLRAAGRRCAEATAAEDGCTPCTLYFVDIDEFKTVNDSYGHAAGDALLREVGARLRRLGGKAGIVARQSGDEFLLLRPHVSHAADAAFAETLIETLSQPVTIDGHTISATCSVGVCMTGGTGAEGIEALIKCADTAMYVSKRAGPGRCIVYGADMESRCRRRQKIVAALRRALDRREIAVNFQPILSMRSGTLAGFEALVRWRPADTDLDTGELIDIAEDTGLIVPLGRAVRDRACAFARDLASAGIAVPVSVNASRVELRQPDFADRLAAERSRHGLAPAQIRLELTETIFDDKGGRLQRVLQTLADSGVPLALDDFGKGFSSHGLLATYPFSAVKIDMASVAPDLSDPKAVAILRSLIDLGRMLDLETVLECVDCADGQVFAQEAGVDAVQGFHHFTPLTHAEAITAARGLARPPQAAE